MPKPAIHEVITLPKASVQNLHHVPEERWAEWDDASRILFNHLYEVGIIPENQPIIFSLDLFPVPEGTPMADIVNAAAYNMAWLAADKVSGL